MKGGTYRHSGVLLTISLRCCMYACVCVDVCVAALLEGSLTWPQLWRDEILVQTLKHTVHNSDAYAAPPPLSPSTHTHVHTYTHTHTYILTAMQTDTQRERERQTDRLARIRRPGGT
jgi:hypothetical protein